MINKGDGEAWVFSGLVRMFLRIRHINELFLQNIVYSGSAVLPGAKNDASFVFYGGTATARIRRFRYYGGKMTATTHLTRQRT
jgi:hypothetical protein